MNNDNKYLEELKNAYDPYKQTLIISYKFVNKIALQMQKTGYTDNQIKAIANSARKFWNMEELK